MQGVCNAKNNFDSNLQIIDIYLAGNIEASIKNPPVTTAKRKAVMYITKRAMKIGYLHE